MLQEEEEITKDIKDSLAKITRRAK